jgi:hypothetical protein
MKKSAIGFLVGSLLGIVAAILWSYPANAGTSINCWTRDDAVSYGYVGWQEGYELGGGWWNDNNYDDTPGCSEDGGSSCEGPDCSGFVFKTWAMQNSSGATGYTYWEYGENIHGPYASYHFRDGCSGACYDVCGSGTDTACGSSSYGSTLTMDAFAQNGHIGMIWAEDASGYDYILEAYNNTARVVIYYQSYRNNSAYDGVRRSNWCEQ